VSSFNQHSFLKRSQELLRPSALDLLENPEISFFRNGKNPFLYITSILVIVCQCQLQITMELKKFAKVLNLNGQSLKNSIENIENHMVSNLQQQPHFRVKELAEKFQRTQQAKYKHKLLKMFIRGGIQYSDEDYKSESTCITDTP
jgi:hypothetical protein